MARDVQHYVNEWTNDHLKDKKYNDISALVAQWNTQCFQLYKKLNEDYPDTAEVA